MISDADIVSRLQEILKSSDMDTATAGSVRRQLEDEFGVDLSDRKAFIRYHIDAFLTHLTITQEPEQEQEEENRDAEVGQDIENVEKQEEESVKEEQDEIDGGGDEEEEEEDRESLGECENKGYNKVTKVKKRGGFNKLCGLSSQLQDFIGESEMARPQVVKRIWTYIKENNLQDPNNKRNIKCDESLRSLFRVNTINMFQMNKALSKHIWPLDAKDENVEQSNRVEQSDCTESEEDVCNADQREEEDKNKEEGYKDLVEEVIDETDIGGQGKKKKGSTKVKKDPKKRGGGFTKLCSLSPQLQTFTRETKLARTEVVKRLWKYIKENNLQDPKNKRNIICDESLHGLFHVDSIDMFQMNKALSKHIWPLNEEDAPDNSSGKEKRSRDSEQEEEEEEDSDESKQKEKRQKKGTSGLLAPLPVSDALINFFGTGESTLSRADVVKRMWEYIKQNDLQDPSDKRRILCDDKLKALFNVDSFLGFSVTKLLTVHFIKPE